MYNVLGETSILILSLILLGNILSSFSLRDRRNLVFFICTLTVTLSTLFNILSVDCINNFPDISIPWANFVSTVYFLILGISPFFFSVYCYNFFSDTKKNKSKFMKLISTPMIIYTLVVFVNLKTGIIFRYDAQQGYIRGPLKFITYIETAFYATVIIICAWHHRKNVSRKISIIFLTYPLITVFISMIQFFSTYSIMTGTSAFATLLLIYLSVQSEIIEYDIKTGLLTEKNLSTRLLHLKEKKLLTIISIENFNDLQETMGLLETDNLMLSIAQNLKQRYGKYIFKLPTKFAVLTENIDQIKYSIHDFFANIEIPSAGKRACGIELLAASMKIPEHASTYTEAIELANNLLAKARATKGRKYIYCDDNYIAEIRRAAKIEQILEEELFTESDKFQIYFQPIYSVKEKKFLYAEALSRLKNTEIGDISPAEFIPIAESKGLIERLGQVSFEKICIFLHEHYDSIQKISVNFSVKQMINPKIADTVLETIKKYHLRPENIIMEITESIFIDDFDIINKNMNVLSKAGIVFYLDDFGTGFSNFANVITLPFTTIKIDRSFVLMMEQKKEMTGLMNSLISTFKNNGLKILVEGVETKHQDEIVKRAGTDYIQGFLYARPLPPGDFIKVFNNQQV